MRTKTFFLDANIFLRFLTGDDRRKAQACRRMVQKAVDGEFDLVTHPMILAEVVWVLESYYRLPRKEIATKLQMIMNTPHFEVTEGDAFIHAVELYSRFSIDLADCFAAAVASRDGFTLISYDQDFDKFEGIRRAEPGDVA